MTKGDVRLRVRDTWISYRQEVHENPARAEGILAFAEANHECFGTGELTGNSADELPPLPGDQ